MHVEMPKLTNPNTRYCDLLIVGSGAAGLAAALKLATHGYSILLLSKDSLISGSTAWAQGGIAAAMRDDDHPQLHAEDTIKIGYGLCNPQIVAQITAQAPGLIAWLRQQGVLFTHDAAGSYQLMQESGHSRRRIVHTADHTGYAIATNLAKRVQENNHITWLTKHTAYDLIIDADQRCIGAYVLDCVGKRLIIKASATVLACGGASAIYQYTSVPNGSVGDGIAMAWRAGCRIANLEFNQFHPTCFQPEGGHPLLISETMRGEGAQLLLPNGKRFLDAFDVNAELAPRDILARAITQTMNKYQIKHVNLDITHRSADFIRQQFPTTTRYCKRFGIDITKQPIPVSPASHYSCGGIRIDSNGVTDRLGLYAIGEVACSGLHGANRLASNALLECIALANNLSYHLPKYLNMQEQISSRADSHIVDTIRINGGSLHPEQIARMYSTIRKLMWEKVGIIRSNDQLRQAQQALASMQAVFNARSSDNKSISTDNLSLRNLLTTASLTVSFALARQKSCGAHHIF